MKKTAFRWLTTIADYDTKEEAEKDMTRLKNKFGRGRVLVRSEGWTGGHNGDGRTSLYTVEYSQTYKDYNAGW